MDMDHIFCFFMHKSDVGKNTIHLMRPFLYSELGTESFRNLIKELHIKKYSRLAIQREFIMVNRKNEILSNSNNIDIFSSFSDHLKHSGITPSSSYLRTFMKAITALLKLHG